MRRKKKRERDRKSRKKDKNGPIVISINWDAREEKESYQRPYRAPRKKNKQRCFKSQGNRRFLKWRVVREAIGCAEVK